MQRNSGMRFLIVDDSVTMQRYISVALKALGYSDSVEAGDGREAMKILKSQKIDFILTDWNMPNMNGLQLIKAVRQMEKYANVPILMITTRGNKEDVVQALKAKANNYVVKPFTPEILNDKINSCL